MEPGDHRPGNFYYNHLLFKDQLSYYQPFLGPKNKLKKIHTECFSLTLIFIMVCVNTHSIFFCSCIPGH